MRMGFRITIVVACLSGLLLAAAAQAQIVVNGDFSDGVEGWTWTGLPMSDAEWDCDNDVEEYEGDDYEPWIVLTAGGCEHLYGGADPLTGHVRLFQTLDIPVAGVYELRVRYYHIPAMCCDQDLDCWPTSTLTLLLGEHEVTLTGDSEWLEADFELQLPAGESELEVYLRGGGNWHPDGFCWVAAYTTLDLVALEALTTAVERSHWSTVKSKYLGSR